MGLVLGGLGPLGQSDGLVVERPEEQQLSLALPARPVALAPGPALPLCELLSFLLFLNIEQIVDAFYPLSNLRNLVWLHTVVKVAYSQTF